MSSVLAQVSQYMITPVVVLPQGTAIDHALARLLGRGISAAPVVDDEGQGVGVVSCTDLLRVGRATSRALKEDALIDLPLVGVETVMTAGVATIGPSAHVSEAAKMMESRGIHRVFVASDEKLLGAFSTKEVLRALVDLRARVRIEEIMSGPLRTVRAEVSISEATDELESAHVGGLAIVDREGFVIGIYSQREALCAKDRDCKLPVEVAMTPSVIFLDRATPVFRAAAHALTLQVRRVVVTDRGLAIGMLTGLNFARAAI